MPRLTYSPEGADPKVWDFTFGRIKFGERAAIEKATGLGWSAVQSGFWQNRADVIHAFLWVLLKRDIPTLRATEVDFFDDEIEVDLTDDEAREARVRLKEKGELDEDEVEALAEIEKRFAVGDLDEEPDPKED